MEEQIKEKREEKFPVEDQIVEKQEGSFLWRGRSWKIRLSSRSMPGDWGERVMLGQCEVFARVNLKYYEKGRVTCGKDMGEKRKGTDCR